MELALKSIYISKKEVARKLNISPSTVVRWSKSSIIPMPFSLGSKIVWDENELNQAIEERKKHRGFLGHKPVRVDKNVNKTQ